MNEELENNYVDEDTETERELKKQFTTVISISKYLALALFIALPFIGGWIGYTYSPEKVVEVEKVVEIEVQKNNDISNSDNLSTLTVGTCSFYDGKLAPIEENLLEKTSTEHFKIWVPDSVELIPEGRSQTDYLIKDKDSKYFAKVHVYNLQKEVVVARRGYESSYRYDVFSKAWWTMPYFGIEESVACNSDNFSRTSSGAPIAVSGWADAGDFTTWYNVVFEDDLDKHMTAGAIQFSLSGSGNDAEYESHYKLFNKTVEKMIQTVEPIIFKG